MYVVDTHIATHVEFKRNKNTTIAEIKVRPLLPLDELEWLRVNVGDNWRIKSLPIGEVYANGVITSYMEPVGLEFVHKRDAMLYKVTWFGT